MEAVYHFVCENSVLLLNGSFVQSASSVRYERDDPLYVTVLPLDAAFLPYTVQFLGGKAHSNAALTLCCDMGDGHFFAMLKPRYAYVYSSAVRKSVSPRSLPARLMEFVREGNFAGARALMSDELSSSVTDEALSDFFEGVADVRENVYTPKKGWLLLRDDGKADICEVTIKGGLIENILFD